MAAFGIAVIIIGASLVAVGLLGRLYASTHRPARGISQSPTPTDPPPPRYRVTSPRSQLDPSRWGQAPRPPVTSAMGPRSGIDGLTDSERERELKKLIKQFSKH